MPPSKTTGLLISSLSVDVKTIKDDMGIHQPHRVCISDETGNVTTSDVTVDELSILNQIKGDVQAEIDAYKEFVINTCNQIVNQLDSRMGVVESNLQNSFADVQLQSASVSLDDLQNTATRNVITNGFHYGNLKVDASTLEVQNLNTLGETAVIKSNTIRSSNFEIISESLQDAAVKIVQSGTLSQNSDFIDVRVNGDSKLVVKNSGMIGVNNSNPTKHLDVVGDVNFTGKINDVTVAELSQLSGSTDSLQTQINNVYSKIAAYTTDIDNHLSELKAPIAAQITSVTNTAIASIDTLKQDLMNIAIDTSNYLMNTKQDAIVFDDNFIYDAIGKTVSLNNKSVWVIDENEPSLRKGNIAVYENHVSKITFQEITTSNREYPPVNISGSGLDVSGFTSTIADQEYGNGDYKIYWSSSSTTGTGMHLFNNSNKYSFEQNTYDQGSGLYKGNKHLVKGYGGEWVVLEFPFQFLVSSVKIEGWDFFHQYIPKDFKVYGSDDNKNWNELGHFIDPVLPNGFPFYFVSNITTTEKSVPYKFIGLCFHKTHSATTILLNQIVFIGKEYAKIFHQYALETDLETKSDIVSGAASSVLSSDFNFINKVLISSIDGKITSSIDISELNNLLDVDSNIQLQLDTMNNTITVSSNQVYQKLYEIQSDSDTQVNTITTSSLDGFQDKIAGVSGAGLNFDSNTNYMSFTGTIEVPALTQILPNVWKSSASGQYISYSNVNVYHDKITIKKEVEKQHPYVISNGALVSDNNFVNTGGYNYTYSFTNSNNNSITFPTDGLIDVLIVGGGGSGGSNLGGGGGGGTVFAAYQIPVKGKMRYPIIVGAGGRALYQEDGGDSSAFGIVALGGGAGGNYIRIDGRFKGTGGGGGISSDGTVYGLGGSNIDSNLSFSESTFGENSAMIGTEKYGGDGGGNGISETYFIENVVFGKGGQGSTSLTSGDGGGQVGNINGAPNTGGGGGGGALGMNGGDGGAGLVIVHWNMQPAIKEHRLITNTDLSTKQDLLNFSSNFTHDNVNNIVSVATPQLWEDNFSYISRGNVKIYNDRIKIGTGIETACELHTNTICTNSIIPYDGSRSLQIGDGIEITNSTIVNHSDVDVITPVEEATALVPADASATQPIIEFTDTTNGISYKYCAFTSTTGTNSITFDQDTICDVLVVGGGGAGGFSLGSGGGAGGLIYKTNHTFSTGTYNITIGAGGTPPTAVRDKRDNNGKDTYIKDSNGNDIFRAFGGGGGAGQSVTYDCNIHPRPGGSGSGGNRISSPGAAATQIGEYNYGNNGGNASNVGHYAYGSGGGGGAGSVGGNGTSEKGGNGGDGLLVTIRGVEEYFAGGGGGSAASVTSTNHRALGGLGGGGNGGHGASASISAVPGENGVNGTGGGGGGGEANAGSGGSGIVIIRWRLRQLGPIPIIEFTDTTNDISYQYCAFTTDGSITFNRDTVCDILLVGGGGSGAINLGGGSSGGLLYATSQTIPSGSYPIIVGTGGVDGNGSDSIAFGATAKGGSKANSIIGASNNGANILGSIISQWIENKVALNGGNGFTSTTLDTVVRKYPPTGLTGGTISANTITKEPSQSPSYGLGEYTISWSSHIDQAIEYSGDLLFDGQSVQGVGWISEGNSYNTSTGLSTTTSSYIGNDSNNHGQWVKIKLPVAICLTSIELYARQLSGWQFRNPLRYVVYGSNDNGANWIKLIDKTSADVSWANYKTSSSPVTEITTAYSLFAFVFTKIGQNNYGDIGFNEIMIYGKEQNTTSIGGGGGGTGSVGESAVSLTSTPNGGDGFVVPIRRVDESFAPGGGANGGTRVPVSANIGYGGNSTYSTAEAGGDGIVIIRWISSYTVTLQHTMTSKGNIWMDSANVVWTSDERIKRKIEDINDEDALNKVLALEPKKYQYKDYLSRGDSEVYGFVSQQVKEVIPEATTSVQNFIPNVYQFCNYTNTDDGDSIIQLPDGFDISALGSELNSTNISGFVKLYNNDNETLCTNYELTNINNGYGLKTQNLTVFSDNRSNIFVYGTQVDDMITIDKSYLFTLNVCATQILAQKVQALETTNSELLAKIDALENEILALESS